ncbi:MAG: PIN domain nuclease [Actinomycetota bacterium]|nr:PIN domain nuclease [Actinomycetota bacterium]
MTLVDTSAWIEYLRATQSPTHHALRGLIEGGAELATTEVVVMEVLAGGRDADHVRRLRGLLGRCRLVPLEGLADYEEAAGLYRRCRRAGATVRALADCLVAAVALRAGLPVLHADRDFDVLAEHTGLTVLR